VTSLSLVGRVPLPPGRSGGLDHADVDPRTGRVFVAHTDFGTVDVIDPTSLEVISVIDGCPEGSGVICSGDKRLVFAASRGAAKVLLIDADKCQIVGEIGVGPKPNGLAYAASIGRLLIADVDAVDQSARLADVSTGEVSLTVRLPGRPRWCVFDSSADRFLINIRDPASVLSLSASGSVADSWPVSSAGPHGLDLDRTRGLAFVACDGGILVVVDLESGRERAAVPISGPPDAIWFNPRCRLLYVAAPDPGVIDVVDTVDARVVETITVEVGAKTTAFDVDRQRLYAFLPKSCAAAVFEQS
jgi:DNA-binding beta-propeller fold protein YncE